jgi:hypothetical protein
MAEKKSAYEETAGNFIDHVHHNFNVLWLTSFLPLQQQHVKYFPKAVWDSCSLGFRRAGGSCFVGMGYQISNFLELA